MGSSDGLLTILLIIIFMILYSWTLYTSILVDIKKNWSNYKCQPLMIPLSFMFGADPTTTFKECIKTSADTSVNESMTPLWDNLSSLADISTTTTDTTRKTIDSLNDMTEATNSGFAETNHALNGLTMFIKSGYNNLQDIIGKFSGIIEVLVQMMRTTEKLTNNLQNSEAMRKIREHTTKDKKKKSCFYKETIVPLETGECKKIIDVNVGDKLTNNIEVIGILKLKKYEPFYKIRDKEDIYVTGSHLIFDKKFQTFIAVEKYENAILCDKTEEEFVYCLITNNHLIPVGSYLFHDWEDRN